MTIAGTLVIVNPVLLRSEAHPVVTFWTTAARVAFLQEPLLHNVDSQLSIGLITEVSMPPATTDVNEEGFKQAAASGSEAMPAKVSVHAVDNLQNMNSETNLRVN